VVWQCGRQTFDVELAQVVVKDASFFHTRRNSAGEVDRDLHPDRLAHRDFEEVRMQDGSAYGIDLKIAQEGRAVRCGLGSVHGQ